MSYNTCTALFSNFTSVSSMTECLKKGNAFAVLGNHRKLFKDKNEDIERTELDFLKNSDRGDIKLYFLKNDSQKLQTIFENLCDVYRVKTAFNANKKSFYNEKKNPMGDIILGIFLGICVYDIAQDLVLLKNNTDGSNKASIEILKHYYDDEQTDTEFFTTTIKNIYSKREKKLTDAFLKIKDVCDYFCFFTKNYPYITEKYDTAFYNILIGTYFHGDCKYLDPSASTLSERSQQPKRKTNSKKKLNAVQLFKDQHSLYLETSLDELHQDPDLVKRLFPTHENFSETFEDNPSIDSIQTDEQFTVVRDHMKELFIAIVYSYGFEFSKNNYSLSEDNNVWNEEKENQNKYLKILPEMVKSLWFFNHDHAVIFIDFLKTLNEEPIQAHDSYKKLMEEIDKIEQDQG